MDLFSLFKKPKVQDSYLGEMEVTFDTDSNKFILCKDDQFVNGEKVPFYFETPNKLITDEQRETHKLIKDNFEELIPIAFNFLINEKKYLEENMVTEYKTESITILDTGDKFRGNWSLDLLNLRDEFSHIIIEFEKLHPIDFEVLA